MALRCALLARPRRAPVRRRRDRARLRPGVGARRDRGQAPGAAAGARRLSARRGRSDEPARDRLGDPAVQSEVLARGRCATSMIVVPASATARLHRAPQRCDGRGPLVARSPYSAAACAKSRPCGVATCSSKPSLSPATGRKWKIPPPSLLSSTIVSVEAQPPGREQAADVVGERDVADQQHDRAVARRRRRRTRVETVPSIPLAPRFESEARRELARGEEHLDVADRHRGGDEQRRVRRQPLAEAAATAARTARRQARSAITSAAASSARAPGGEPVRVGAASRGRAPSSAATGSPRIGGRARPRAAGSCQAPSGSIATCAASGQRREPGAQRLGGRQVADADHELGRVRVRRSARRAGAAS